MRSRPKWEEVSWDMLPRWVQQEIKRKGGLRGVGPVTHLKGRRFRYKIVTSTSSTHSKSFPTQGSGGQFHYMTVSYGSVEGKYYRRRRNTKTH